MTKIACMNILSPIRWFLLKEGLFPISNPKNSALLKLLFNFIVYSTIFIILLVDLTKTIKARNTVTFNAMSCVIIPVANLAAKLVSLWWNKESFLSLINDLESPAFNIHSEIQNQNIQIVHKLSKIILKMFVGIAAVYIVVTGILPFVANTTMMIPPPMDMGKYALLYKIVHIFMVLYLGSNSVCNDLLFLTLLALCIAQQNILEQKLLNVHEEALTISINGELTKRLAEKQILKTCVILHETINGYIGKLNIVLAFPLLLQYTCGCFLLCSTVLQLAILHQTDTFSLISICSIITIIFSQLACYHWLGNEITIKSSNIMESCYLSKWYNLDHESQMTLLLLMEKSKHRLPIQLYKFIDISLESLGVIIRWSYSLFALIKARYN